MEIDNSTKSELLDSAQALLRKDDEERAESLRPLRWNGVAALVLVAVVLIGVVVCVLVAHARVTR